MKVLIISSDFGERTFLESVLARASFDVASVGAQPMVATKVLEFGPKLIITETKSNKINGGQIVMDIRAKYPDMAFIFVVKGSQPIVDRLLADGVIHGALPSPVNPAELIRTACDLMDEDPNKALEKFQRSSKPVQTEKEELQILRSDPELMKPAEPKRSKPKAGARLSVTDAQAEERQARYSQFLSALEVEADVQVAFDRKDVKMKKDEIAAMADESDEAWDAERRRFVQSLFDDKKS